MLAGEDDLIANMGNLCSAIKFGLDFLWVGFYLVKQDALVLSTFQGPIACTRIQKGRGVCGTAWQKNAVIIVDDVEKFPGHIACSSLSKSEIVLPLYDAQGRIVGVFDVDSNAYNTFDSVDEVWLKKFLCLIRF